MKKKTIKIDTPETIKKLVESLYSKKELIEDQKECEFVESIPEKELQAEVNKITEIELEKEALKRRGRTSTTFWDRTY